MEAGLLYILGDAGIVLLPTILLLFIYGMCLTDPARPDYCEAKIRRMFRWPDPGVATWLGIGGVLFGIGIAVVGGWRASHKPQLAHEHGFASQPYPAPKPPGF